MAASKFQSVHLVASPSYSNSIAWSDDNLLAVACGHLVTILNPATPAGPRGLIRVPSCKPFPVGVIEKKDLLSNGLLPTCLSRDRRPSVRSVSWSHLGLAPDGGCLLGICTAEGRVKIYRPPVYDFRSEWVEVVDISDKLYDYLSNINFEEMESLAAFSNEPAIQSCQQLEHADRQERKRRKLDGMRTISSADVEAVVCAESDVGLSPEELFSVYTDVTFFPSSDFQEGSTVEVLKLDESKRVWVAGRLEVLNGERAKILFSHKDANGEHEVWVRMNPDDSRINFSSNTMADQSSSFLPVRPSMNMGNLPEELTKCRRVSEVLKAGEAVEVWMTNRWVEGQFMGFDGGDLQVKICGDIDHITLGANSVRLAPVWIGEKKMWQVTVVKVKKDGRTKARNKYKNGSPAQLISVTQSHVKPGSKKIPRGKTLARNCNQPLITAGQYASRNKLLSSLVIAWSPPLHLSTKNGQLSPHDSAKCFSLLAVGGKAGKISFWRIWEPECYSVELGGVSSDIMLLGLLQAHSGWVTAISWASLKNSQVLLTTGSSDGSVKIWLGCCKEFLESFKANHAPFSLLKEVSSLGSSVSIVTTLVPVRSPGIMLLAFGKGSGSFEVWICDITLKKFNKAGLCDAHDQIITGLVLAFDGYCLYSCSQDNSLRSWTLDGNAIHECSLPPNIPGVKSSAEVRNSFNSCFGIAVSPGNMVLAAAYSFDADVLNPMYQGRAQKAAVEYFWIGGQQVDMLSKRCRELKVKAFPGSSERELVSWVSNVMWSLSQYEQIDKPLILWDMITLLLALRQSAPTFVNCLLLKWLSLSYFKSKLTPSKENILSLMSTHLSSIPSRKLHLLNIICRRVVLSELKADQLTTGLQKLDRVHDAEEDQETLWLELLLKSERELRERLVGMSFSVVLSPSQEAASHLSDLRCWSPVGLAQMQQWVALNLDNIQDQLKQLALKVQKLDNRHQNLYEYTAEEQCSYCSASVPFESPEVGLCRGKKCDDGTTHSHKLVRCAVSMKVCPTTPLWYCICCQRSASVLPPKALFALKGHPSTSNSPVKFSNLDISSQTVCPFCGIVLQRLQPEFLLSVTPV